MRKTVALALLLACTTVALALAAPACQPPPAGLVSWWPANGSCHDLVGTNGGAVVGRIGYTNGAVGQAFHFDGDSYVEFPNSPSLNPAGSFSIECWVFPSHDATGQEVLVSKWGDMGDLYNQRSFALALLPGRVVEFSIADPEHQSDHSFQVLDSASGTMTPGTWNHLVAVYDQSEGTRRIYLNGAETAERTDSPITILNSIAPLTLGAWYRSGLGQDYVDSYFTGSLDEVSFYNRALGDVEVQGLYRAGSAGKCTTPMAPAITTQPASRALSIGASASFSVAASGTWPLSYQWSFNGARLNGQTTSSLSLTDIQSTNGGTYAVVVTNRMGSVTSSKAVLTVCLPTIRVGANMSRGNHQPERGK